MTKRVLCAFLALLMLGSCLAGCKSKKEPEKTPDLDYIQRPDSYTQEAIGADGYMALDRLAFINLDSYNYGVSSAGRDNGNSDGFNAKNWLYIDENGDHVICEAKGKGIVNRIWTTGTYNERAIVKIYVDNEAEPVYSDYYYNFTKGTVKPFLYPIAKFWNQSAGGRLNYLPIEFNSYIKIAIEDPGVTNLFWHVDYTMLEASHKVESWTGLENLSEVLNLWENVGLEFKPGTGAVKKSQQQILENGTSHTFFETEGKYQIQSIKITIPDLKLPATANKADDNKRTTNMREELNGLRLKIYWDGEETPSVDCSLGMFFGIGTLGYNNDVKGLFYGVNNGVMYNYFPMPFQKSCKLVVENSVGKTMDVKVDVTYKPVDYDFYNVGYFTTCEKNFYVNNADPIELHLLDVEGSGKIVSIQLNAFGNAGDDVRYEEGDVRIYIDGSRTPQQVSPGMEDFFNGAGYFIDGSGSNKRGLYTTQLSGYTSWLETAKDEEAISVYRVFANDAFTFRNGISFCIEHGGGNRDPESAGWHQNKSAGYETLLCYYHTPVQRMEETDRIDLSNTESMTAHSFTGATESISVSSGFWSGFDLVAKSLSGVSHTGEVSFQMKLNKDNHGAVLYRVFDYSLQNMGAAVYVDGQYAGEWYKAGYNDVYTLSEDQFIIPAALTAGKETVTVRIVPAQGDTWTAMEYTAYSIIDKAIAMEEELSGYVVNFLADQQALTVSGSEIKMSSVDAEGRSDFRLVRYHDGSYFVINSYDGSVLCAAQGQLATEKITTQTVADRHRWVITKTENGYKLINLADRTGINANILSAQATEFEIRFVTERKDNIF